MHETVNYTPSAQDPWFEAALVEYRAHRPPPTSGNPYTVLGEPVGDLRDNMGCRNRDLSAGVRVWSTVLDGVPARCCQGREDPAGPCVFFIHGGGFVGGSVQVMENPCKYLAQAAGGLVVNIDYRLAPETPFPGSIEDCVRAVRAVLRDEGFVFDRRRVFVAGDSAGANLALACAQKLEVFAGAVLYYPVVDLACGEHWHWDETVYRGWPDEMVRRCATGLKNNEPMLQKLYLQGRTSPRDPLASPIYRQAPFCPLLIQYAEYDYLRLQAEAFARRSAAMGTEVDTVLYQGLNHAFLDLFGIVPQAKAGVDRTAAFLRQHNA